MKPRSSLVFPGGIIFCEHKRNGINKKSYFFNFPRNMKTMAQSKRKQRQKDRDRERQERDTDTETDRERVREEEDREKERETEREINTYSTNELVRPKPH